MSSLPDQIHQIIATLIATRHRAGLSQRALGDKVGLAQSHISKIERAAVDPQLSSLVEIARTLGLELMLIPTQLVPAIQALRREAVPDPRRSPSAIDHDLTRLARHARELLTHFPGLRALSDIASASDELRIARLDESKSAEARASIDAAENTLDRLRGHPRDRSTIELSDMVGKAAEALAPIARAMRSLRNEWIQRQRGAPQSPAYRLDDSNA